MYALDLSVLYFFNITLAHPVLDQVMAALTSVWYWMPVYIGGGVYLISRYRTAGVIVLLAAILLVTLGDQLAQLVLKPLFDRPRPCAEIGGSTVVEWIRLPTGMRHGPSFPSSHAMNNAAVALFFAVALSSRRLAWWLGGAALVVGVTRMYLGVHYPSDILGGFMIGAMLGWVASWAYRRFIPSRFKIAEARERLRSVDRS